MLDLHNRTASTRNHGWRRGLLSLALLLSACGRTELLPPRCVLQVEAQAVDFGDVAPGSSASRNIGVANPGSGACLLANPRIADGSDPGFALGEFSPSALVITPGHRSTIPVSFAPPDVWPPLDRAGTLVLESNDPTRQRVEVPLTARILSNCTLSVSPSGHDFGHVALDASSTAIVHIENTGNGPCALSGLGFAAGSDAQFALAPSPETAFILAPGDQLDVPVSFYAVDASAPHHRTAQFTCQSTDPKSPTVSVPLSADIDVGCSLTISPTSLNFGNVILNTGTSAQVSLGNDGSAACQVSGITLAAGTDAGFSLDPGQTPAFTVEPGAQQSIPVRFDAFDSAPPHLKTGTLVFQTGNPRAPDGSVPLSAYVNTVCVEASQWIYTVDSGGLLSKFDPATLTFTSIATLNCPGNGGPNYSSPNSMAVDQNAVAWVAYLDGNLFKVDTSTGKCEATSFQNNQVGFYQFGMGFVFDPSTGNDTLYIAGSNSSFGTTSTLATVAFPSLAVTPIGIIDAGLPELTGTGDGELWGFIAPGASANGYATLARFDPATGKTLESHSYRGLTGGSSWAMKFWGGSFWLFLDSSVYQVSRDALDDVQWVATYGHGLIVGAGVSTCAPVQRQ